jgi:hypothetical protein
MSDVVIGQHCRSRLAIRTRGCCDYSVVKAESVGPSPNPGIVIALSVDKQALRVGESEARMRSEEAT